MSLPGIISRKSKEAPKAAEPPKAGKLNKEKMIVEDESSEGLTLHEIIEIKPKVKIVREFFRQNLAAIKSEEEELFDEP